MNDTENSQQTTEHTRPEEAGASYSAGTDTVACPDCGVQQERSVFAQEYKNHRTQYYIEEVCPVCGFDGVWY
jgi:rubredoxin